ncbi:ATP-binding cassette domain-containing protein [Cellulomonas triticagri]|uniref:ATP-binding cassette domain-containing protein n=1 Tax=Cellulomonas triticagri TaxID=2483352 RepID=UPI0013157A96|nr:ATP-binding cassette domain-containing protein [Cellulomonas triticagri]
MTAGARVGATWGLTGVTVRAGGRTVLDDVTLAVPPGEVTAVVGGDGAGKSTLARLLVGRVLPDSGTVAAPGRARTGYLPATSGVWADLSVAEHVDLVASAARLDPATTRTRAAALLGAAGLADVPDRLGRALSGGMRQKLGFCLALLPAPDLVVLDEPSTGVDPVSRVDLWRMMSAAAADGVAVLLTTTYLDEAERAATVLVLDAGAEVYRGDPAGAAGVVRGAVAVLDAAPADGTPVWRRGRTFHALVRRAAGAAPADLEDAVIALALEHGGAATRARPRPPCRPPVADDVPAVVARHVVTTLGDVRAVDEVDLDVHPGEVVGLLGANGAGKTTLIRTLLGLLTPTSGTVTVLGGTPDRGVRRQIGYVPQGLGLAADLTVAENLAFVAAVYGLPGAPEPPPDLAGLRDRLVGDLGLGLQRRLAFAAALAHRPGLLVLDEPTSGVDPLARAALWDTVHEQAEAGAAVLVTTHYMQEAEQCDRLLLLSRGRAVGGGTLDAVLAGATSVEVRAAGWQAAFAALGAAGLPVTVAGRVVRVAGVEAGAVEGALAAAGVAGEVRVVPARLEEVLVLAES